MATGVEEPFFSDDEQREEEEDLQEESEEEVSLLIQIEVGFFLSCIVDYDMFPDVAIINSGLHRRMKKRMMKMKMVTMVVLRNPGETGSVQPRKQSVGPY